MKYSIHNRYRTLITQFLLSSLLLITIPALAVEPSPLKKSDAPSFSFGVVPQQSAKRLAILWGPMLNYLSEKTGIKLQFKTAKNIPTFEKRLANGEYDFAYMNPYHFVVYNNKPGYKAIAVRKNQPISGIIVTRKDSSIRSLNALSEKTLAFPSPAAFAASILPQAELNNRGVTFKSKYVSSHDSVYLAVAKGLIPAGGGVKRTFNNTPKEVREKLTVLWISKKHTPHAFATHPRVKDTTYKAIQNALINMGEDKIGKEILLSLKLKHGLITAKDSDWNDVRDLNIKLLEEGK